MKTVAILLFAASVVAAADAKDEALEGKWKIVSVERDGKIDDKWTDGERVMKDGKYEMTPAKGDAVKGGYKLIELKSKFKAIDFTPAGGQYKDKTLQGIYAIDGDTLKICFAEPGKDRPTEFSSKGNVLTILKREK
jgi:uncharacterized protein (TIGR03067 family)